MRRLLLLLPYALLFTVATLMRAQAGTPAPAEGVLDTALKEASLSKKNVFLVFHATWCSWCKRLDAALEEPEVKKIMDDYYVIVHLDVMERGEKAQTVENPGGKDLMKTKLADSNVMPGNTNIGFPGSKEEIAAFDGILRLTAPRMTEQQRSQVTKHLGVKQ
jgi:thioredoxin-related protein